MVIIYPMLCANSISYSSIPGIAKAMERYILIHKLDDVLQQNKIKFKKSRGRLELKESNNLLENLSENFHLLTEDDDDEFEDAAEEGDSSGEEKIYYGLKPKSTKTAGQQFDMDNDPEFMDVNDMDYEKLKKKEEELKKEKDKLDDEKLKADIDSKLEELKRRRTELDQKKKQVVDATTKVSMQMDALSLEPTWMYVDRYTKGGDKITDLIGVKVVPFMINSDEKLVNLLMYDKHIKGFNKFIVSLGRKTHRKINQHYKNMLKKIPFVGEFLGKDKAIKGDPKTDIIMAKTSFKENVFVCLNKLDFEDDFFKSTQDINKLFKLGWGSIIAMDDSQKTAYFCVEEFKGICFPVQYGYIFSTLGKDHSKVFEDLNDVKKSSGGLFRRKTPKRKLFENVIYDKYMNDPLIKPFSEIEKFILKENFQAKKESIGILRDIKDFFTTLKTGDSNRVEATLKRKSKYKNISEAKNDMVRNVPGFKNGYNLAKSKLKNKLQFNKLNSQRILEIVAVFIGIYAIRDHATGTISSMKYTNKAISKLEKKIDRNKQEYEKKNKTEDIDPDYILGMAVFSSICVMLSPIIMMVLYISVTNPGIYVGLVKLVLGVLFFIPYAIFLMIKSILIPTGEFLLEIYEKSKDVFGGISDFISKYKEFGEKFAEFDAKMLDWIERIFWFGGNL
ncbi:MAG: hypothetical protein ACOC2W_00080 [bacterium]